MKIPKPKPGMREIITVPVRLDDLIIAKIGSDKARLIFSLHIAKLLSSDIETTPERLKEVSAATSGFVAMDLISDSIGEFIHLIDQKTIQESAQSRVSEYPDIMSKRLSDIRGGAR